MKFNNLVVIVKEIVLIIFGGLFLKYVIINVNFFRGGIDYVIYIIMVVFWDGLLSGVFLSEGVSWGKIRVKVDYVEIWVDVMLVFFLLVWKVMKVF